MTKHTFNYFRLTIKKFFFQDHTNKHKTERKKFVPTHKNNEEPKTNILKSILLKGLQVKSLQQICLNYINREGPSLLKTVLKISDDEASDDEDDKITESSENSLQQNGCLMKTRRMERVRYWNDDDFLFFENFLLQEQASKRKVATKLNKKLIKETDVDMTEIKQHLQNNKFLQLNSAVSIQLLNANCNFKIKCEICGLAVEDLTKLAIHKLEHLTVSTNRIDEVKILNGALRRGRIILVQNQKRVRCSNCLKTFSTAPLIKEHWADGKCDFFCKICGLNFHTNPFLLRVHYSSVHGIRFTVQGLTERKPIQPKIFIRNIEQINSNGFVNPSTSGNPEVPRRKKKSKYAYLYSETVHPGRVTCNICSTSFPNMKSRNSHMRLHKLKIDKPAAAPVFDMNFAREYTCGPCGIKCKNKSILYSHKKNCPASNQYSCPFCLKKFPASADLQVHVMNLHPD